jgi:hypothetical protein
VIKELAISNLGSFVEFTNELAPFSRGAAIVHGMNGSGKSQFCSLLQLAGKLARIPQNDVTGLRRASAEIIDFAKRRKSKDNSQDTVTIRINSSTLEIDTLGGKLSKSGTLPRVYVFNDDYVATNIGDDVNLPEKVIRIGERNKLRDDLHLKRKKARSAIEAVQDEIDRKVETARQQSGYAGQARTTSIISKENYLKTSNPYNEHPNARAQLDSLSTPPELITSHLGRSLPDLGFSIEERQRIDHVFSNAYIEPTVSHSVYQRYLRSRKSFYAAGVQIYKEIGNVCPFCLSPKDRDDANIAELIAFIESDYNDALNELSRLSSLLMEYKKRIGEFLVKSNADNSAIRTVADRMSLDIKLEDLESVDEAIDSIVTTIGSKCRDMANTNLMNDTSPTQAVDRIMEGLKSAYRKKIEIIEKINNEIERIVSRKRTLGEEVIKNCMHSLWSDASLRERLQSLESELAEAEEELQSLSETASNDKTIGLFNQIIRQLGIQRYELNEESKLILKLEREHDISQEGYRISTGERKFIAFSYFLAEVLASVENSGELSDVAVFIDDPVDSSDYEKFYSFVSVIENLERILQRIYQIENVSIGQLYLFTHNALLFERLVNSKRFSYFAISIEDNRSVITVPKKRITLMTFSSYLKKITNCIKRMQPVRGTEIGNCLRCLLEIIASVENIDNNKIEGLCSYSKLNALANHLSHESIERLLDPLPESYEYIDACIEFVELLKERIPYLYATIRDRYLKSREITDYRLEYEARFVNKA